MRNTYYDICMAFLYTLPPSQTYLVTVHFLELHNSLKNYNNLC